MYYVYRFLDRNGNIIYVGKSKQVLEQRFRGHSHLPDDCYEMTYEIEYIECATESDMSIKEIYYINKFRHDGAYFNILDMTNVPASIEFADMWKQYKGPLPEQFKNSINYINGYTSQKKIRYNLDGSLDRRKTTKEKGVSSFVYGLSPNEVDLVIDELIDNLNAATNANQEQIRFRNLMLFILGINLPQKSEELFKLRYQDILDDSGSFKDLSLTLNRSHNEYTIRIPIKEIAREVIAAYVKQYGMNYENNANEYWFETREHKIMSQPICGRIIATAAEKKGITKNLNSETLRKTFFLNVYHTSKDPLNAILFLGKFSSGIRDASIIKYLNLTSEEIDYDYYFGEEFSLGNFDISRINCVNSHKNATILY